MPVNASAMSEEELVKFINSGDYDLFPELINRIMPHISASAAKWKNIIPDTEDLVEEGVLAVFTALRSYESEKASFKTFANMCVDRAINAKVRAATAQKRIPNNLVCPIEDTDIPHGESAEEAFIRKEENNDFNTNLSNTLTGLEQSVLKLFLDGDSYADIANTLGVSRKSVDGALRRVRSKLKK